MRAALIELHYLPSLEYFVALKQFDKIIIEVHENYQKQSYRNRCYILSANKIDLLSVPVKKSNRHTKIKDLYIDYSEKWSLLHWRAICTSYQKSPFFAYYASAFHAILSEKYTFLFDLNIALLNLCLSFLGINTTISFSDTYEKETKPEVTDLRSSIHPKILYKKNGFYQPYPYNQVFGKVFSENLSIIDLLFCEGPQATSILEKSSVM